MFWVRNKQLSLAENALRTYVFKAEGQAIVPYVAVGQVRRVNPYWLTRIRRLIGMNRIRYKRVGVLWAKGVCLYFRETVVGTLFRLLRNLYLHRQPKPLSGWILKLLKLCHLYNGEIYSYFRNRESYYKIWNLLAFQRGLPVGQEYINLNSGTFINNVWYELRDNHVTDTSLLNTWLND